MERNGKGREGKGRGARREAARVTASALVTQASHSRAAGDSGAAACENDEDEESRERRGDRAPAIGPGQPARFHAAAPRQSRLSR